MKKALLVLLISFNCYAEVIDGNTDAISSPRDLSLNSIEAGGSYNYRLTTSIKNYTLTNLSGQDRLWTFTAVSKMVLENTTLELDGTYTFSHGSIQIVGNCVINGSSDFNKFRFESHLIHISEGSELKIGPGVNFEYAPTSSYARGIVFADSTSKLTLQDATLTVSNRHGLNLIKGQLRIEGNSTIDNFFNEDNDSYVERRITYTEAALFLGYGTTKYGDCKLKITSGSKLTVKNAGIVFQNKGTDSFDCSDGNGVLKIDKKGSFLVVENENTSLGGVELDAGILSSNLKRNAPVSITYIDGYSAGGAGRSVTACRWHPSGKYLTIMTEDDASGNEIIIFNFDGNSLNTGSPAAVFNWTNGANPGYASLDWANNGKYFFAHLSSGGSIIIFYFNESDILWSPPSLTVGVQAFDANWSPDGIYVSICGGTASKKANVYSFDGENLKIRTGNISGANIDWASGSISDITYDGKYIAYGTYLADGSDPAISIYRFEDGQIAPDFSSPVVSLTISDEFWWGRWSQDGRFLMLSSGSEGVFRGTKVYEFDGSTLTSIARETNAASQSWSKWLHNDQYICSYVDGSNLQIYPFDGNDKSDSEMNTLVDQAVFQNLTISAFSGDMHVSPDGKYIAVCGETASGAGNELQVYKVEYNLDNQKSFLLKDSTINLTKDVTLRDINLKLK